MKFDDWLGDRIDYISPQEYAAEKHAWEAGIQEGIDRMYRMKDCPESTKRLQDGQSAEERRYSAFLRS